MIEAIHQIDLHADIRSRLERFIRERGLGPGDRLPSEHELVRDLHVSRNALREALRSLEALGLIKAEHGRGRYLNGFSFETLATGLGYLLVLDITRAAELMEIRRTLEAAFLPTAARRLDEGDITRLREVVAAMREKSADGTTTSTEERAFHTTLFSRADNRLLKELLTLFWDLIDRVTESGRLPPSRAHDMIDMHQAIVDHIAAAQYDEAAAVLDAHFDDLAHRLEVAVQQAGAR